MDVPDNIMNNDFYEHGYNYQYYNLIKKKLSFFIVKNIHNILFIIIFIIVKKGIFFLLLFLFL